MGAGGEGVGESYPALENKVDVPTFKQQQAIVRTMYVTTPKLYPLLYIIVFIINIQFV